MTASAFDIVGPLPSGITNISASAGTGKTYTLSALAVRYVAEADVPIGEVLVVTFTRAAAGELKDRIRKGLLAAEKALRPDAGEPDEDDELLVHLYSSDRDVRHKLLRTAIADFDAATITTIHGFAQQALGTLGESAPADPDASLVEDSEELTKFICADTLAQRALDEEVGIKLVDLHKMASKVLSLPDVTIVPDGNSGDPVADQMAELVNEVVERVREARRAVGTMAYDDILTHLRDAIVSDSQIAEAMGQRFGVALIDEFQDTDPVQWEIFSQLFANRTLVLVGDPKQAIYAFRGADVHTYLRATARDHVASSSLLENWRSDGALLTALNAVLKNTSFGDGQIRYIPVQPAEPHAATRIAGLDGTPLPPLVFRNGPESDNDKPPAAPIARAAIASDLAQRVRDLLENATIPDGSDQRRINPGDIAVLVRSHSETPGIQRALASHGIPSVMSKVGSVFSAPAAAQLRRLLAGVARPASQNRVRAVALGWFGVPDAAGLDCLDPTEEIELAATLHDWAEVLANRGVSEFAAQVWAESGVATRVLQMPDGDRHLTDLEHLIEVLGTASADNDSLSVNGLLERFDVLSEGDEELPSELLERRIESDATSVQIMTVHGSKGLEWPIVCCPSLSRQLTAMRAPNIVFNDDEIGGRVIDVAVSAKWPGDEDRRAKAKAEDQAEAMRLAYVALTRAKHQVIVWRHELRGAMSPLSQVLFGPGVKAPSADAFDAQMMPLVSGVLDLVEIGRTPLHSPVPPATRWSPLDTPDSPELSVASLGRNLIRKSKRWSFTAISSLAGEHQSGLMNLDPTDTSGGDSGGDDEYQGDDASVEVFVPPITDLCWGEVPGSAAFGTMVHSAFEEIDFNARGLKTEVGRAVDELGRWHDWPADVATIKEGIHEALTTPLGPMFGGRSLSEIPRSDRLDEMVFDFRCGGGAAVASDSDIGRLILDHIEADHGLYPWAQKVAAGLFRADLQGHMTGSIDVVIRLHDPERYVVVDYKTNSLSEPGMPLMSSDYHPDRLSEAMAHHHYPLQALLYSVALHRYLRWRVDNYRPEVHLAGAAYLFVRGMSGADTATVNEQPYGVFGWDIPTQLVVGLSDLLNGSSQ